MTCFLVWLPISIPNGVMGEQNMRVENGASKEKKSYVENMYTIGPFVFIILSSFKCAIWLGYTSSNLWRHYGDNGLLQAVVALVILGD